LCERRRGRRRGAREGACTGLTDRLPLCHSSRHWSVGVSQHVTTRKTQRRIHEGGRRSGRRSSHFGVLVFLSTWTLEWTRTLTARVCVDYVGHCGPSGLERLTRRVVLCQLQCSSARFVLFVHISALLDQVRAPAPACLPRPHKRANAWLRAGAALP